MKVVVLCGGLGTRLREETEYRPKPLVPIGEMPILWHIMKTYSHYGFKDFILCLGYKGEMIKDYFLKFEELSNDFSINLRSKKEKIIYHGNARLENWTITFVNTGKESGTGSRVAQIKNFIGQDKEFLLTYGDGVAKIDLKQLVKFHRQHGKIATVTGVRPPSRFGEIVVEAGLVRSFNEKPAVTESYINGGYFVFKREFFDYLSTDEECTMEKGPLESLAKDGELMMFPKAEAWQCMDTYRDYLALNQLWEQGKAFWQVWQ